MLMRLADGICASSRFRMFQPADRDDARGEALLASVKAIGKYNTARDNALAYFSRIITNAMSAHGERLSRLSRRELRSEMNL